MNSESNPSSGAQESEPRAGSIRAPAWLLVLIAVLAFWGMGFLDNHAGGFQPEASPVSAGQVKAVRDKTSGRSAQWFVTELLKINGNE